MLNERQFSRGMIHTERLPAPPPNKNPFDPMSIAVGARADVRFCEEYGCDNLVGHGLSEPKCRGCRRDEALKAEKAEGFK